MYCSLFGFLVNLFLMYPLLFFYTFWCLGPTIGSWEMKDIKGLSVATLLKWAFLKYSTVKLNSFVLSELQFIKIIL